MEKENGKSSSLELQSRRHLYCHVAAASTWCPGSRGLSVSVCSKASSRYLAREIKSKEINVLILYPMFFFMDRTEPDLLSISLLFLTLCTHEPQLTPDIAQAHLYPAPKFPSSPEAFPRFPTSPTKQTDKFSTPLSLLIPLPRWSSQGPNLSLLHSLQTHNSTVYCYNGFKLSIFFFSQG